MQRFSKKEVMRLIESGERDWEFALSHIQAGLFDNEEIMKILKACDYYWHLVLYTFEANILTPKEMVAAATAKFDRDIWDVVKRKIDFPELETTELLELLEVGNFGSEITAAVISTGKFNEIALWSFLERSKFNPEVAKALLELERFSGEQEITLLKTVGDFEAANQRQWKKFQKEISGASI